MQLDHPVVSGDSHLEVEWKRWAHRVPAQHRHLLEGETPSPLSLGRWKTYPGYDESTGPPGTGSASQRLREQDMDGLAAEVLFPAVHGPRTWRTLTDDPQALLAITQAYNSWLAEEYCSEDPTRLIGVGVLPWTGVDDCVAELERCARLGLRTVALGVFPSGRGHPTPEDDRFWAAAVDLGMPICVHVELDRNGPRAKPLFQYPIPPDGRSGIVDQVTNDKFCHLGGVNAIQLIFAGVFDRFPSLRIDFAENQIGWLPHFYEQADERFERHWRIAQEQQGIPKLKQRPSDYMREHIFWGFQTNRVGVEMRHYLKVDRLIWASDFPHQETNWPDDAEVLEHNFAGIPAEDTYKMTCANAVEFFHLEDYLPIWRARLRA